MLAANQASATCICNDTAPFDHSAVTYQDYCENICSNVGGVKTWSPPRSGTCTFDSDCGAGEVCTADGCMPSGTEDADRSTDACGGMCLGEDVCNEDTGECGAPDTTTGVDNTNQNQLPTDVDNTKQKTTGPANVQLPNFIGVTSISGLILKITDFLITLAIPFAVLMLIWAGFLFATAQGSPDKIEKAKKNLIWTVAGIAVILASQAIISYITEILGGTGSGAGSALITKIKGTLYQISGLLFVLVTVYFFWGVAEFVRASGSGDTEKIKTGKKHMVWGIIGMVIMAGAWGIVEMIRVSFQ